MTDIPRSPLPVAFEPRTTEKLWVGDITYIPIARQGFCYLATSLDRHSRRIIGWTLDKDMTESLVLKTLRQAIRDRQLKPNRIRYTDRGGQYAGTRYRAILNRAGMRQNMNRERNVVGSRAPARWCSTVDD